VRFGLVGYGKKNGIGKPVGGKETEGRKKENGKSGMNRDVGLSHPQATVHRRGRGLINRENLSKLGK